MIGLDGSRENRVGRRCDLRGGLSQDSSVNLALALLLW
jgi:hypothetical protein